jgi:ribosomal protein L7/L12
MDAADFINFLNNGLTPEQEKIYALIKQERNTVEYYKELANTYREHVDSLERQKLVLQKTIDNYERNAASNDFTDWTIRAAAAIATPIVMRSIAEFAGFKAVDNSRKIELIKHIRALTGLSLFEAKEAAVFFINRGTCLNTVPLEHERDEMRLFQEKIFLDLRQHYISGR